MSDNKSSRRISTSSLLVLGVFLFIFVGLLLRPVDVLREVRTESGEVVRRPDGKRLMKRDPFGQLLTNLDAYFLWIGGVVLLGWAVARPKRLRNDFDRAMPSFNAKDAEVNAKDAEVNAKVAKKKRGPLCIAEGQVG